MNHSFFDGRQTTSPLIQQPIVIPMIVRKMRTELTNLTGLLLVVDDVEMNRDALSRRLTRAGHKVKTAGDGETALRMLVEADFDVVLLDVMMPGISGLEVLAEIRRSKSADVLPVIMATAKSDRDDVMAALDLGANDYVTKPLDFPLVQARVQNQLALKNAREKLAADNDWKR